MCSFRYLAIILTALCARRDIAAKFCFFKYSRYLTSAIILEINVNVNDDFNMRM